MDSTLIFLVVCGLIALFLLSKNLLNFIFSLENYNIHRKRLKQLRFEKKDDKDLTEMIDIVTKPVINYIFPKFKPRNLEKLETDLRVAQWNKYFTPIKYRALNLTLKILGVFFFAILSQKSMIFAISWAVILIFGMDFLFNNSVQNRKTRLIADFPDFIRITEGYLSANIPFTQAIEESIKYVGDEWKPILKNFIVECDMKNIDEALNTLRNELDLFEVKEFVALVRLTLEQGGSAQQGFSIQADRITELRKDMMAIKIGRRQMYGTLIQAPLLLCNIMVFALPTVASMMNLSSM